MSSIASEQQPIINNHNENNEESKRDDTEHFYSKKTSIGGSNPSAKSLQPINNDNSIESSTNNSIMKSKPDKPNMYGRETVVDEGNPLSHHTHRLTSNNTSSNKHISDPFPSSRIHVENIQDCVPINKVQLKAFIKKIDSEE